MSAKVWCDEKSEIKMYMKHVPLDEIKKIHGISQTRLYGIIRDNNLPPRRPERADRNEGKVFRDEGKKKCQRCGEMFFPYAVNGQKCTRLCPKCWRGASVARRSYSGEISMWASI